MADQSSGFASLGISIPKVLLPKAGTDLAKWTVVACDQFTSQPEYWKAADDIVGEAPSTLRLMLPELYLEEADVDARVSRIHETMDAYLSEGVFADPQECFVYVERTVTGGKCRRGLVVAMDLECYDYRKGSTTLTRATEATVEERLPPRVKIRQSARLETPHVMVLIDDPDRTVIEPLANQKGSMEQVYDVELMQKGGHLSGYRVPDKVANGAIRDGLAKLAQTDVFKKRYDVESNDVLLYAMGDGNHSLASAKSWWERCKSEGAGMDHPARYALVELVNVHDEALEFEPIHRVVFGCEADSLVAAWKDFATERGGTVETEAMDSFAAVKDRVKAGDESRHVIGFTGPTGHGVSVVSTPYHNIEVGTLQLFLDEFLQRNQDARIDYIHGDDVVSDLSSKDGNMGFLLPVLDKNDLFRTVVLEGALPRKAFSMGEAQDKRYYMECRAIR